MFEMGLFYYVGIFKNGRFLFGVFSFYDVVKHSFTTKVWNKMFCFCLGPTEVLASPIIYKCVLNIKTTTLVRYNIKLLIDLD